MGLAVRGTSLAVAGAMAFASLAAAQSPPGDVAGLAPAVAATAPSVQDAIGPVSAALSAARSGEGARLRSILDQTSDPFARKVILWLMADQAPEYLSWDQVDDAGHNLADWPHPARRQMAGERLLNRAPLTPEAIIGWFGTATPLTAEGAMALAGAFRDTGHPDAASEVIRRAWRTLPFDRAAQSAILTRFPEALGPADHTAREDLLLYGLQGDAAQALLPLLPADQQAVAQARMAVRRGDPMAHSLIDALPQADQTSPGLVYERILAAREHGDIAGALALIPYLPATFPDDHAAERLWRHGSLVVEALQAGDNATAYQVAARSSPSAGPEAAEAQFYAGWIALSRLGDPKRAESHFARLETAGESPLTQSRALYWRGRAAEAEGDPVAAELYYSQAAKFYTTFYGQMAASRGGQSELVLGKDPEITPEDRARFERRDVIRATRLFAQLGARETFRAFVVGLSDSFKTAADEAMLVDLTRDLGEQELSMKVVRNAAHRGLILPERGYPVRTPPDGAAGAEAPLVLGVARQESGFDPKARSGAGARGMMQLMPGTAQTIARRSGLGWGSLDDPDYNMKVGSTYLGQLVGQFSGNYAMAAAAYNAGPGRPTLWATYCGDPRDSSSDPLDFIECIPFSETRDYVMRVLEATQVYRARLNGGHAPLSLAIDLKRGGYGLPGAPSAVPPLMPNPAPGAPPGGR